MTTVSLDRILGMFLSPGDVQRLSLRLEGAMRQVAGRHQPFPWGVCSIDHTLRAGVLVVQKLDAVMPNGLHIARDDDFLRLDLRPLAPGDHTVYLTVTLLPPDEANRFLSDGPARTADEVLGDDGIELPRARMRLALVTSPPASPDTSIALLKVRNGSGARDEQWSEVKTFVPPLLTLRADSRLGNRCRAIAERLRRDADALTARANAVPPTLATVETRAQLGPLVTALAGFEVLLTGQPHPFTVYVELCRLAAAVSVLRRSGVPVAPPYDHNDLWAVFDTVARSFAPAAPAKVQKFTFLPDGQFFRLPFDDAWARATAPGSPALPVLAMESDAPEERARRWGENCVIGSRSRMPRLESRRMLGPARTSLKQVDGIPGDRRTVLFAITPDANTQSDTEDLLVLNGAPDVKPTALHLYIVHAGGAAADA
jgi:predicted component of type VI protein secretion system